MTLRLRLGVASIALCTALVMTCISAAAAGAVASPSTYTATVFSDGFESGSFSAWDGPSGTGNASVSPTAAHTGSDGAALTNAAGQYELITKTLSSPLVDSTTSFWANVSSGGSVQTLAQARDSTGGQNLWTVTYDPTQQGLTFYPYDGSGASTTISTGAGSAPLNTWFQVQVVYTANSSGGAQIYINGQTQSGWGVSGDYTRPSGYQKLQLWNDSTSTTYFDDVSVSTPPPTVPAAPTSVTGTGRYQSVVLNWTAPDNVGGSPITGYSITPYANGVAGTPISTGSTDTSYTVNNLSVGTPYMFTVAAINAVGTGSSSDPSATITPMPQSAPDAPTNVQATAYDGAAQLYWSAPLYNGGSAITGYQVTPYANGVAQPTITTSSTDPERYVTGLTDGTSYTFAVAAINQIATGNNSAQSAAVTPAPAQTSYTQSVFADGFESGSFSAWDGPSGIGSATVTGGAAHSGSFGAQLSNAAEQYELIVKTFSSPVTDTSTSFWARVGDGGGIQELAEARDPSSSQTVWSVIYDPSQQGLYLYPFNGAGTSTEIFSGPNSVPVDTWFKVEVRYNADSNGGAQLYLNGQTQSSWSVSGNYARSDNFQKLQLWDDSTSTTYFDDVQVSTIPPSTYGGGGDKWKPISPIQLLLFMMRLAWAFREFHQSVYTPIWSWQQNNSAAEAAAASAASQALRQIVQSKQDVPSGSAISALYGSMDDLSATLARLAGNLQQGQSDPTDLQLAETEIAGLGKEALATGVGRISG
jgi:hypothetical protein